MIIKNAETNKKEVGPMKISEYKINASFSGALIEIDGAHGKIKCIREDRIYFIVGGSGEFVIDDITHKVSANDLVFVPKDTPYNMRGKMKYFLVCSPEFNSSDDVKL